MNESGSPTGRFDFRRGALRGSSLTLYPACLVHRGAAQFDVMALGGIGAVRVAYERDARRIGWGVTLGLVALAVFAVSGVLADLAGDAANDMASRMRGDYPLAGQGIVASLHAAFLFLQALAEALPIAAGALGLWGLALIGIGALGSTTFAVAVGASERAYAVPGRNTKLFDFAEMVGEALSQARR